MKARTIAVMSLLMLGVFVSSVAATEYMKSWTQLKNAIISYDGSIEELDEALSESCLGMVSMLKVDGNPIYDNPRVTLKIGTYKHEMQCFAKRHLGVLSTSQMFVARYSFNETTSLYDAYVYPNGNTGTMFSKFLLPVLN